MNNAQIDNSSAIDSNGIWTHSYVDGKQTLNGWVFIYELSGCGFKSRYCQLNFRNCTCFEQEVPWHSGNYRV